MILDAGRGDGLLDTGASYPGCSRETPDACQGAQFASLADAVAYAYAHGEVPVIAASEAEVWAVMEGTAQLQPSRIIPPGSGGSGLPGGSTMLYFAGAAVALMFLLRKKKS
jgi:hypothetical protein